MKTWIRRILFVLCLCVFAYSAFQLVQIFMNYNSIEEKSQQLIEQYVVEEKDSPVDRKIDFDKLQKQNPDVIGWLYIPDTNIDEPLLKGENNNTYLRTGIDHQKNSAGQIFIDQVNNKNLKDDNTIVYGHNMKNGSRFHNLRYYMKKDFFEEHQYVYIFLPHQKVYVYKVFASNIVDVQDECYQTDIDYTSYVQQVSAKAKQKRNVSEKKAPLLLLSTCYDTNSDDRYVVFARLEQEVQQ